jgi:hydrophobe/amphiphile efflux-3 (HAE3) family protein
MSKHRFANFVIRFPWLSIALFVAVAVALGFQFPRVKVDTEMKNQLPKELPTRVNLDKIEKLFGGTDMVMIIMSADDLLAQATLERLQKMSKQMEKVKEFDRVMSLFTAKNLRAEDDVMTVEKTVRRIPKTDESREELRARLKNNKLVYGNMVSKDFKHTVLIGFLGVGASDQVVIDKLNKIVSDNPGPEEVFLGGMPITRVTLSQDIRKDMRKFLPVGLLLMLVFLFFCFRQARGVLLPFLMTVMSIVFVLGLVPLMGWKIHTVTVLLPVILLAVANNYGIHIMARYQENRAENPSMTPKELASTGIIQLTKPVLATGLTTMVGLICLLSHIIIPARQLGVLATLGVAFAMLGSLLFIPAILSFLPTKARVTKKVENSDKKNRSPFSFAPPVDLKKSALERLLDFLATRLSRRPKTVLVSCVVFALAVGAGTLFIKVDSNPMSFYEKDNPAWRATNLLNKYFGGWAGISVVAEGDIKDPAVMNEIDKLDAHLKRHPLVGTTMSIADVVRGMNRIMNNDDPAYDRIPDSRDLIAQYFLLYSMSGDSEDFSKLVDFPYRHAQVIAQVRDSGTKAATDVVDYIKRYLAEHPDSPFKIVGGFLDVLANMVEQIVRGQLISLFLSIVLCGALVGLLLRSTAAGFLSMVPLGMAILLLFGVMGYLGIELNLITAMLSSIMIGVGIDYTIHFLWRYRDERNKDQEPIPAVIKTITTTGRGIVFNAFSVIVGFVVLLISAFSPVRFFGLLVVISISACLVGALVVLPAIAIVFRPKFLEPKNRISNRNRLSKEQDVRAV